MSDPIELTNLDDALTAAAGPPATTDTVLGWAAGAVRLFTGAQLAALGDASLTVSATAPASPDEDDLWIDSSDYTLYVRQGSAWVEVTQVGPQGLSAYQVAVENGFVGTESAWLASLEGTNVTITVAADQEAFDAATPTATELVVLYAEA